MDDHNRLKGIYHYGEDGFITKLEVNIKFWLDWALLRVGGWQNATMMMTDIEGTNPSRLRPVVDSSVPANTIYEGSRKDWVWESGIDYNDGVNTNNPLVPATVFVDGSPATPEYIDYPRGRVVFSSAQSTTAVVEVEHSYRLVQIYRADDVPWIRRLEYDSTLAPTDHGDLVDANTRIQLPAIIIETIEGSDNKGYQLGDGAFWANQDVMMRVIAMTKDERDHLVDMLRGQFDNTIWLFNTSEAAANDDLPLDQRGEIIDNTKTYPYLVDPTTGYRWKKCRIIRTRVAKIQSLNPSLYEGGVRWTCQVVLDD